MVDSTPLDTMRQWMLGQALSKWGITGFDAGFGGFRERLDLNTQQLADSPPYRLVTQARQIYVFSHAALLDWFPNGRDLAALGMETLRQRYRSPDDLPGYAFSVTQAGAVADARRDTYGHAFVLFALAWYYKLTGDAALVDEAFSILDLFDTAFAAPDHGGYLNGIGVAAEPRLQNPHMHLLEAMLAWHEATGDSRFLAHATAMFELFATRFWQPGTQTLPEYFDATWAPAAGDAGQLFEPGHHLEWAWLLRSYARASGQEVGPYARGLYRTALTQGLLPDGRLVDAVLPGRGPARSSTRLWPHTEWVKAAATAHEAGDTAAEGDAMAALAVLQDRFCRPELQGGWIDHLSEAGQPIVDYMPATSLYHLFLALAEADRVFGG